ncbi:hypothetical protein F4818DRAFT_396550 [Hypoxylon cercidicola]|nr:hypothetical protein F4818DRAFT_396550 [Hypoxylon cercidicola]
MEVLGAVAATGQLIGTGFTILDAISQLRDFLKHAPGRCQGWCYQLDILSDTISCIRQHSQLQTYQVVRIIEGMAPKINNLAELCSHYAPQPKNRLYMRLSKALAAKGIETRILQSFQSLECDKTSLILTISTIHRSTSIENKHLREEMAPKQTQYVNGPPGSGEAANIARRRTHPEKDEGISPVRIPPKIPPDIIEKLTAVSQSTPPQQTMPAQQNTMPPQQNMTQERLCFKKIKVGANGGLIGTTSTLGDMQGGRIHFEEVETAGNAVIGVHSTAAAMGWAPSPAPHRGDRTNTRR